MCVSPIELSLEVWASLINLNFCWRRLLLWSGLSYRGGIIRLQGSNRLVVTYECHMLWQAWSVLNLLQINSILLSVLTEMLCWNFCSMLFIQMGINLFMHVFLCVVLPCRCFISCPFCFLSSKFVFVPYPNVSYVQCIRWFILHKIFECFSPSAKSSSNVHWY